MFRIFKNYINPSVSSSSHVSLLLFSLLLLAFPFFLGYCESKREICWWRLGSFLLLAWLYSILPWVRYSHLGTLYSSFFEFLASSFFSFSFSPCLVLVLTEIVL